MRNINNVVASMVLSLKQSLIQIALVENKSVPNMANANPRLYIFCCLILQH